MTKFKPNLIPNNPKDGSFDINEAINKNGGYSKYLISFKKDGCRLELKDGLVLTRSLKSPGSNLVIERFQKFSQELKKLNIVLEGEFYMHGLSFNEIYRFFSATDVTSEETKKKLEKELTKSPEKFKKDYNGRDIKFLTTFHKELKFWAFDGYLTDAPEIKGFGERMVHISKRLKDAGLVNVEFIQSPIFFMVRDFSHLNEMYEHFLKEGFEGLVLVHKDHEYKFGRSTLNQGTLLKMKDDALEYDGVVIDIEEGTIIKEGVERTTNELGRSVTSKKKGDREPSGKAKGIIIEFENKGTFSVGLKDFDDEQKAELLKIKKIISGNILDTQQ